jgi:hypothetical protein
MECGREHFRLPVQAMVLRHAVRQARYGDVCRSRRSQLRCALLFRAADTSLVAMKIVQPSGKNYVVYQFFNIAVNGPPSPSGDDPFHPPVPFGWHKIVEESLAAGQLGRFLPSK